jgi:plastocyanin
MLEPQAETAAVGDETLLARVRSCDEAARELDLVLAATNARAEVVQVRIEKPAFVPAQVTAHGGDAAEWVNADFVAHTATARDGAWDVLIPVNGARSVVLNAPGQVDYYCKFHPNMTGRISVGK